MDRNHRHQGDIKAEKKERLRVETKTTRENIQQNMVVNEFMRRRERYSDSDINTNFAAMEKISHQTVSMSFRICLS